MKCKLTGENVNVQHYTNSIGYDLTIGSNTVEIFFCHGCDGKIDYSLVEHHIVKGLIINNLWPDRSFIHSKVCTNNDRPVNSISIVLEEFLTKMRYPKSTQEKLDNLLQLLSKLQKVDGERIFVKNTVDNLWIKGYFKTADEFMHYIHGLAEDGLIQHILNGHEPLNTAVKFTMKGLKEISQKINGSNTENIDCFIAMAFDEKTKLIREVIKRAISSTGYKPIIIDEVHLPSDKTIPSGIMEGIKRAKFVIADFTFHKNGVYFESGIAIGAGKPVIYLCEEKEFEKAHFDTKQLQHIIYKTHEELKSRLKIKIGEFIK